MLCGVFERLAVLGVCHVKADMIVHLSNFWPHHSIYVNFWCSTFSSFELRSRLCDESLDVKESTCIGSK